MLTGSTFPSLCFLLPGRTLTSWVLAPAFFPPKRENSANWPNGFITRSMLFRRVSSPRTLGRTFSSTTLNKFTALLRLEVTWVGCWEIECALLTYFTAALWWCRYWGLCRGLPTHRQIPQGPGVCLNRLYSSYHTFHRWMQTYKLYVPIVFQSKRWYFPGGFFDRCYSRSSGW